MENIASLTSSMEGATPKEANSPASNCGHRKGIFFFLRAEFLWVNCETNYSSSNLRLPHCGLAQCVVAQNKYCHTFPVSARPFCHKNTCGLLSHHSIVGKLAQAVSVILSTDGSISNPMITIPNFIFTCSPSLLVKKVLPMSVEGVVGLAQALIAVQNQLVSLLELKFLASALPPETLMALLNSGMAQFLLEIQHSNAPNPMQ
ncbi:hypothetical protein Nepgr_011218 [Nepenthes gracilis]|uniref:Xylanase inhibitor N-terminal domain-containing protein n=1 Tax=Nepenthes gracilis TaxID=150966 RepID=A0AAD3SET3_NEPGR|nr:hypothetical protein Nepgr_011218 [Nepenthes gracilis]